VKNAKIVLVAQWDGWCGACAVERPLVLTRSGRLGLRTWLTAPVTETRPLTLTCRLCGGCSVVPAEHDDPPVLVEPDDAPTASEAPAPPVLVPAPLAVEVPRAPLTEPVPVPATATIALAPVLQPLVPQASPAATAGPEVEQARGALGAALRALLAERTAQAGRVGLTRSVLPHVPAVAAPALPLQRSSDSDADSLATLQLLADGLDLLSASRV